MNNYKQAFDGLNADQKRAVITTEGPVMVLAGPGSGKTQVLGTRIGYILDNTDTLAQNILCLTFTEAGVVAMRERLIHFIGKEAFKVNIHTFHSFCNKIIQENPQYFSFKYEISVASDLQKTEILREMIDLMPKDDPLKRLRGDFYTDVRKFQNLFSEMKREVVSIEKIEADCKVFQDRFEHLSDVYYSRKSGDNAKGDRKEAEFKKYQSYCENLISASKKIDVYNDLLKKADLYDYDDMLSWVLKAFSEHEELLLDYQEQFLYILVDEFQDTNGIQMELINQLCSYWEDSPNIFVVGDDDQAIYRFQGANVENLTQFYDRYQPEVICLKTNYRSRPQILNAASTLIDNNFSRVDKRIPNISKTLLPFKEQVQFSKPEVRVYANIEQEDVAILKWIDELIEKGTKPNEIAVVSRNHAGLSNLVQVCLKKHIPTFVRTKINALKIPIVKNLVTILHYLDSYLSDPWKASVTLVEMMQYPNFGIPSFDIVKINHYCNEWNRTAEKFAKIDLREVISSAKHLSQSGVNDPKPLLDMAKKLEKWIHDTSSQTLQVLFELVLNESNILEFVLNQDEKISLLEAIHSIFNFIKDETAKSRDYTLRQLIETLDKMEEYKIDLPFNKIVGNSDGIQMMTAHGTKGLEYPHVWIRSADSKNWESARSGSNSFFFDDFRTILQDDTISSLKDAKEIRKEIQKEDERRLFFVAITRAEDELIISYAPKTSDKKETPSQFLTEIFGEGSFQIKSVDNADIQSYLINILKPSDLKQADFENEYLDRILQNFKMSSTALNNFLNCPLRFYYSNIMRMPQARSANMGFGNVVHKVLERFWRFRMENGLWPEGNELDAMIEKYLLDSFEIFHSHFSKLEMENYLANGRKMLPKFIYLEMQKWLKIPEFKTEYKISTLLDNKIPLTGNIDRIDIYKDYLYVTDYKTGKFANNKDKLRKPDFSKENSIGGDYWRQIVFYKILLDLDDSLHKHMTSGSMDFIEINDEDQIDSASYVVSPDEIEFVKNQITTSYDKIQKHEFYQGCGKKECHYCNLVKTIRSLGRLEEQEEEDDTTDQAS